MGAPKASKAPEFPDPKQHVDLTALRKEIRNVILDLRPLMRKGEDQNILVEFSTLINPGSFADAGRLPRDSDTGRSRSKRKEECLFARISKMIQDYWEVVLMGDDPENPVRIEEVKAQLDTLREIKRKTFVLYKVQGDERTGYVLE